MKTCRRKKAQNTQKASRVLPQEAQKTQKGRYLRYQAIWIKTIPDCVFCFSPLCAFCASCGQRLLFQILRVLRLFAANFRPLFHGQRNFKANE